MIVKNCLKCLCFSLYIYKKRNVDFLLLCIGLSGAVCGVFLLMRFTESNMVYDNLRYATSNRIGADIAGGNVNVVAMNMCFAFSAWLYLTQSEKAIRRKIIMYGMLIFVVATSLLTGARKILAFYVIAFFFANSGMKFRNKVLIVIGFGLLYAALIYVEPLYYLVGHKLNILGNESSHGMYAESDNTRKNLVIGALNLFTQNPLGYGYGGVTYHLGMYSHNNYTEVLASGGLLGFVCYYALYVRSLFVSYKMRKDLFCKFCWYTLLGVMALEIGQITVTNPMPYVFYALLGGMEYRTVNDA